MNAYPKLVEAVERAIGDAHSYWGDLTDAQMADCRMYAAAALAAIAASEEWWIAPAFATEQMEEVGGGTSFAQFGDDRPIGASAAARAWIAMRTVYLYEQETP